MNAGRFVKLRGLSTFVFGTLLLILFSSDSSAQEVGRIATVSITPADMVRLGLATTSTNADALLLEAADSPLGPWQKEAEVVRNPVAGGFEFLTPHRAYFPQRYYRFSIFTASPVAAQKLPYIRFITPNIQIQPGQLVTLYGANFAPNPSESTVTFELATNLWPATVTQAATNFLFVQVPTNLVTDPRNIPVEYRVSVKTAQGQGNGVAATILNSINMFSIRPDFPYIAQPPGSGKQTLVIGGGTPPYKLIPLNTNDAKNAIVTLNGPLVEVTAATNVKFGAVNVVVQDSSTPFPNQDSSYVSILTIPYQPKFTSEFHTLLAGTEPGANLSAILSEFSNGNFFTEKLELELRNLQLDLSHFHQGDIVGLLQFYDPGGPYYYTFQHMMITEVAVGKASFDIISVDDGPAVVGQGEFIENPPTLVVDVLNLPPAALVSQPLTLKVVLQDQIFRLPATSGAGFSIVAHFSSVSAREDTYLPQESAVTNVFTTTGLPDGAPRIERLVPLHGEIYRTVRLRGSGLPEGLSASNAVTFAGLGGTRVPAEIVAVTNGEVVVSVPPTAVTGPVRVTAGGKLSNDFLFAVRFHPEGALFLDSFVPGAPTTLRVLFQQQQDENETSDEMSIHSVLGTLSGGHIAVSNLSSNQQVGSMIVMNSFTGRKSTNLLVYAGQETTGLKRHIFKGLPSASSNFVLAQLYYSESSEGVTLETVEGGGLFTFGAGIAYDFQFSTPIYVAPSANEVAIRVEAISKPWTSIQGNEMRVIWHSVQHAQ